MAPRSKASTKVARFDDLTAAEVDALNGHEREAWYAHRRGDDAKAQEILDAYPDPAPARASTLAAEQAAERAAEFEAERVANEEREAELEAEQAVDDEAGAAETRGGRRR